MITKAELEKMVVKESKAFEKYDYGNSQEEQEDAFTEGGLFVTGILMPEIERLKAKCDFQLFDNRVETLTAKVKRYEKALKDISDQNISGSNVYDASELMVEVAIAALNQSE